MTEKDNQNRIKNALTNIVRDKMIPEYPKNEKTLYIPVSIDLETTGLDTVKNDIIQIATVVYNKKTFKPTGEQYVEYLYPDHPENVSSAAIERNKINIESIPRENTQTTIREKYVKWIWSLSDRPVKLNVIGHNYLGFDLGFMKEWIGPKLYNDTHHYRVTDTVCIARYLHETGIIKPKTCSLEDLCDYFNLAIPGHDAEKDAIATIAVLKYMYKEMSHWNMLKRSLKHYANVLPEWILNTWKRK